MAMADLFSRLDDLSDGALAAAAAMLRAKVAAVFDSRNGELFYRPYVCPNLHEKIERHASELLAVYDRTPPEQPDRQRDKERNVVSLFFWSNPTWIRVMAFADGQPSPTPADVEASRQLRDLAEMAVETDLDGQSFPAFVMRSQPHNVGVDPHPAILTAARIIAATGREWDECDVALFLMRRAERLNPTRPKVIEL